MTKEVVLAVLERVAEDSSFFGQLAEDYATRLDDYDLTQEERAALYRGDVGWIESHIGEKIDERIMRRGFIPLLSRERW